MSILTKFFGRTASEGAAFAVGTAVGPTLLPAIRFLENEAWHRHPDMPLRPGDAARAAALDVAATLDKADEARQNGVNGARFAALVDIYRAYPDVGNLLTLRRRGIIDGATLKTLLNRLGFSDDNADRLAALQVELLSPADLAMMRQQGFIDRDRQVNESAKSGIDAERADLLFEISGLPPPIERAMEMLRRGIIGEGEFRQIVREGHEKTKYTDEELALRHELLNPATLVALRLRGWIDDGTFHERMRLHGYDAGEADDWFHATGRPITLHQAMLGLRRGGVYGAPLSETPEPFRDAVIRSDIRPEWAHLLYMGRETYPSAFVVRRLVDTGAFTPAEGADLLYKAGWNRELADKAAAAFAAGTSTTSKGLTATDLANEYEARWLTKPQYVAGLKEIGYSQSAAEAKAEAEDARRARLARNRRVELIGQRYVKHGIGRDRALAELQAAEVPARVRDSLMPEWDAMRELTPDALTSAQIKKAFRSGLLTRAETIARLEAKGYDAPDAAILLDE